LSAGTTAAQGTQAALLTCKELPMGWAALLQQHQAA